MGLASVTNGMMVISLLIGLNAAQETLTSQAFGANNLRLCGIYLNRGTLILTVFFALLALVPSLFVEQIFVAIGQDKEVSRITARIVRYMLPSSFLFGQYDLRKRWLACQRITFVPMVASIIGTFFHVPFCYLFMYTCGLGIDGLPLAAFCKDSIILGSTIVYCRCKS